MGYTVAWRCKSAHEELIACLSLALAVVCLVSFEKVLCHGDTIDF